MLEQWYNQQAAQSRQEIGLPEMEANLGKIAQNLPLERPATVRYLWAKLVAAAAVLFFLGALFLHKTDASLTAQRDAEQIAPVQNGVTLRLANGQQVVLAQKHHGQITSINGTQIDQQDSLLTYHSNTAAIEVKMNTLTNNGSSKFSVTFADGTDATLDIGSSLTYPVAFNSNTRTVTLSGQAFFKVKHLAGQRFIVLAKGQTTEDIGTEFNINAYDDEKEIKPHS